MIAGLATGIGGLLAVMFKRTGTKFLCASLGFSAGVMLYLAFMEIMPHAQEELAGALGENRGRVAALLAFFGGMGLITLIDFLIPERNNPHELKGVVDKSRSCCNTDANGCDKKSLKRTGVVVALSLAIHNFPEGIAMFTSALSGLSVAIPLAIAIIIHNIPEGIAISVPIYKATGSRRKALAWAFGSGLAEPLGAVMAWAFLMPFWSPALNGIVFAAVAGIMVYIPLDELLPVAEKLGKHHISILGVVAGMILMALSLFLF